MGSFKCKTKKICIGDLKYRISLQRRDIKPPLDVDFDEEYTTIGTVWAHVEISTLSTSGQFIFDKINIDTSFTHRFFIRYRDDVDTNVWILYKQEYFKIISVMPTNFDKEFLELRCNIKGSSLQESSKWEG